MIDGYSRMTTTAKNKYSGELEPGYEDDYVHCNLGWGGYANGWYISQVFDAGTYTDEYGNDYTNIPWPDTNGPIPEVTAGRSVKGDNNFFRYEIVMLTGIKPK